MISLDISVVRVRATHQGASLLVRVVVAAGMGGPSALSVRGICPNPLAARRGATGGITIGNI
jgi:hypothetical protein